MSDTPAGKQRRPLGLGGAALIVSASVLASRLLGLGRETLLAALLGVSASGDIYRDAFVIPDLLNYLLAGGFLSITLIPLLARRIETGEGERMEADFTTVFKWAAVTIGALTAVMMMGAPALSRAVFPALDAGAVSQVARLTRVALPAQIFFVLGALFMAYQYAHRRFLFPALAPLVYNLAIIGGGLLGAAGGKPTPDGFVWGALAGAVLGSFGLQWFGARKAGLRWSRMRAPGVIRDYLRVAIPLMVGQSVAVLDEQFPRVFGQLAGEGGTAALSFARMLNMLPVGVIAQAAGVASYPFLARLAASGQQAELDRTTLTALRKSTVASLAAGALVVAAAGPLVQLIYQWGAFNAGDAESVSRLLTVFAASIPAWGIHQIVGRWFYAQQQMWLPVAVGTIATVVAVPLTILFLDWWGLVGIAIASSTVMWVYTIGLSALWWRAQSDRPRPTLSSLALGSLGRGLAAAAVAGTAGRLLADRFTTAGPGAALLVTILVAALVLAVFWLAAKTIGLSEASPAWWREPDSL